jgi:hypothetical protein
MCIRKKVFGPPLLIHKNYFGNVGLAISGDIVLNFTYDLDHILHWILCFSVVVAFTINFSPSLFSAQFFLSRALWKAKVWPIICTYLMSMLHSMQENCEPVEIKIGVPGIHLFFFYACRLVCVLKSEATVGIRLTTAHIWSDWDTNSVSSDVVHTHLLNVS